MNDLIKIEQENVDGRLTQTVNARDLHSFLEVGRDFPTWVKDRIQSYGFVENKDFLIFAGIGENLLSGRPAREYHLSLDMAKELAMVERNDKGQQARRYFIECEKKYLQNQMIARYQVPKTFQEALRQLADAEDQKEKQLARISELEPKEKVYDLCMESKSTIDLGIVARMFGYGRNTFFSILKARGILMQNRTPYQEYSHYFKMIENPKVDKYGTVRVFPAPTLKQTGLDFIAKMLGKQYNKELLEEVCPQR